MKYLKQEKLQRRAGSREPELLSVGSEFLLREWKIFRHKKLVLGEVVHPCNLRTPKYRQEDQDFKASTGYMVSLRLA